MWNGPCASMPRLLRARLALLFGLALFGLALLFGARSRRRGTLLRECPPACGLPLDFAAQGTPSAGALDRAVVDQRYTQSVPRCTGHRVLPAAK